MAHRHPRHLNTAEDNARWYNLAGDETRLTIHDGQPADVWTLCQDLPADSPRRVSAAPHGGGVADGDGPGPDVDASSGRDRTPRREGPA